MRLSLRFDQYFNNFARQQYEGVLLISLESGLVKSPFLTGAIGSVDCLEDDVALENCSKLVVNLKKNPFPLVEKCREGVNCKVLPDELLLKLTKIRNSQFSIAFKRDEKAKKYARIEKWAISLEQKRNSQKKKKAKKLLFISTVAREITSGVKLGRLFLPELQQLVAQVKSSSDRQSLQTFQVVRETVDLKDIYYKSFKNDDSDASEPSDKLSRLLFIYHTPLSNASEEQKGFIEIKDLME